MAEGPPSAPGGADPDTVPTTPASVPGPASAAEDTPGADTPGAPVRIHYHRPPDREQVFTQALVHRDVDVVVTLLEHTPLPRPKEVDGRVVLADGAPVVWFTFPGLSHDIGRFHTRSGKYTGLYANILTPVRFEDALTWRTTDLFLDVWAPPTGAPSLLDEEELEEALARGWVDASTAAAARAEAARVLGLFRSGAWPPAVVEAWPLERARRHIATGARNAAL